MDYHELSWKIMDYHITLWIIMNYHILSLSFIITTLLPPPHLRSPPVFIAEPAHFFARSLDCLSSECSVRRRQKQIVSSDRISENEIGLNVKKVGIQMRASWASDPVPGVLCLSTSALEWIQSPDDFTKIFQRKIKVKSSPKQRLAGCCLCYHVSWIKMRNL